MAKTDDLLKTFKAAALSPKTQLEKYVSEGKKAIGCFPYYVPEELVHAAGMVPFGIWGAQGTIKAAKEYFVPFYCTIAQMGLELGLSGKLDKLSGVIMPSLCDTLRPLTQNFRSAVKQLPFIFLAHPQNRQPEYGIQYTMDQYGDIRKKLEEIAGTAVTDEKLQNSIAVYNASREARREFVRLAGSHPEAVTPNARNGVLKSAYFMLKEEHTALLNELNKELTELPSSAWKGSKILISGVLADSESLLHILEENHLAVASDDVAHESRAIRVDAPADANPLRSLARQFADQDHDPLLYDPELTKRPAYVVNLVKESGAKGVILFMMQFCDPEEMEYPSLKQALDQAGIPCITVGVDQQMKDFAQARTQIQAFADILGG